MKIRRILDIIDDKLAELNNESSFTDEDNMRNYSQIEVCEQLRQAFIDATLEDKDNA